MQRLSPHDWRRVTESSIGRRPTQEDLALEANVDRSYVSELEHDKKSPTVVMLFRLCRVIQIRPSELIRRVEEQGVGP